jgi:MSHA biogenesis protein MshN
MSVINRMLSELDARRATPPAAAAGDAIRATVPVRAASSPRRLQIIVLLGAVAISAAAFGNWPGLLGSAAPAPKPVSGTVDVAVAPADAAASAAVVATAQAAPASPAAVATPSLEAPSKAASAVDNSVRTAPTQIALVATPEREPGLKPNSTLLASLGPNGVRAVPIESTPLPAPVVERVRTRETPLPMVGNVPITVIEKTAVEKKMVSMSAAQRAAFAYRQATELAASGHSSQSIDKALEALRSEPDHVAARQLAAVLLFEKKRFDEAGTVLREGLQRKPREPQLGYLLARLLVESGDLEGALAVLSQADGLNADGHGLRAGILARLARYADAAKAYEAAVRLDPENASWWLGLGVALDAEGNTTTAKQAFQRARAIGTLNGELLGFLDNKLASMP